MNEYNIFINKYHTQFKKYLSYEEYNALKTYISSIHDKMFIYEAINLINHKKTNEFCMYIMLKKYTCEEILSGIHDKEIENVSIYFDTKIKKEQNSNINLHPSKQYIYEILNSIKTVFVENSNLTAITNRLYSQLKHLGYTDEDILNEECDYSIIEQLRGNGLGIEYTPEFSEYRKNIELAVSKIFTNHKLETIRNNPASLKYDMSYQFYNSSYHQQNTAFKTALSFYLSGYNLDQIDRQKLDAYINNYIIKDMIKINSTMDLKEKRLEETRYRTQEEQEYIDKLNKQKAAVWAIILSGIMLGNVLYSAIWNMPTKAEKERKKEESSWQDTNTLFSKIENKLNELTYNMDENTFSLGGK